MTDATAQRIWNTALGQLQLKVTRPNYDTWLKGTEGIRLEPGALVVGVPSEFIKEWLSTRMRSLVCQALGEILGVLRDISENSFSRHFAMPGRSEAMRVSRPTKNVAASTAIGMPFSPQRSRISCTSGSSMKP